MYFLSNFPDSRDGRTLYSLRGNWDSKDSADSAGAWARQRSAQCSCRWSSHGQKPLPRQHNNWIWDLKHHTLNPEPLVYQESPWQTKRKGQNEKFMNFAHFCEFWCFSLGKQARFTLNSCSGMPLWKVHELTFLWFGLPGPLLSGRGGILHSGKLGYALAHLLSIRLNQVFQISAIATALYEFDLVFFPESLWRRFVAFWKPSFSKS